MEALAHPDRLRAAAALGRAAAGGDAAAYTTLLDHITHPTAFRRWLGVLGLGAGGYGEELRSSLADPSRLVRFAAWAQLLANGADEVLVAELRKLGDSRLAPRFAAQALRHRPRPQVEALIQSRARPEAPLWVDALSFARAATVAASLPLLTEHGGEQAWRRLATHHPRLVADHLRAALRPGQVADHRSRWRVGALLPRLAEADPDAALDLVEALFAVEGQAQAIRASLARLAVFRPARTFDLIRQRQAMGLPAPLSGLFSLVEFARAERLGVDRICWALANAPHCLPDGSAGRRWFARLSAAEQRQVVGHFLAAGRGSYGAFLFAHAPAGPARSAAFDRWRTATRDAQGLIPADRLDDLPWDLREAEARYHLFTLPYLQSRPLERIAYARLLPWSAAEAALLPFLGHPEGTERARALSLLIGAVRHDRQAPPQALAAIRRRKNEQDPVRAAMLAALAKVGRARLTDALLPEVIGAIGEALDAADLSAQTARTVQVLVAQVLRRDPVAGAALLGRVLQVRGGLDGGAIGAQLSREEARRLDPTLATLLSRWVAEERAAAAFSILYGLGPRLRLLPATLDALGALCDLRHVGVVAQLLATFARHDPARFAERALSLLAADRSVVAIPAVAAFLATQRTDLLDPFLDGQPMTGRFATGRTHWVLDLGLRLGGLHPGQQARYGATLRLLLDDPDRDVPTCAWAIARLAALRFLPGADLVRYVDDPRPPIRDIAIRAVPHLDGGEGLPALLACMGDDRARIATYALRKALAERTATEIFTLLKTVPLGRVTVAKEVLRLMGEHGGLPARDHLIAVGAGPLHRDVRIALLRALWDHIEHPPAWALLEAAVSTADPILVSRLMSIPLGRLSTAGDRRLSALFAAILLRPEAEARLGLLDALAAAPLRDADRSLLQALLRHLGTPDPAEAAKALAVVLARMLEAEVPAVVGRLVGLLTRRPHALALLEHLIGACHPWSPQAHRALGRALTPILLGDATTAALGLRLLAPVSSTAEVGAALLTLADKKRLHHDLIETAKSLPVASPDSLCLQLQAAPDPRLRRVALAMLVRAAAPENGWTADRRARLQVFVRDPSVEVSAAAAWIFPPEP